MVAAGKGSHMADVRFKICQKRPKIAIFGTVWVPRMSMGASNCLGTNVVDEEHF